MKNYAPSALKWLREEINLQWGVVAQNITHAIETNEQDGSVVSSIAYLSNGFCALGMRSAQMLLEEIAQTYTHRFTISDTNVCDEALALGCLQLPFVLDYASTGSPDCIEAILPTLNILRDSRNQNKLRTIDVAIPLYLPPFHSVKEDANLSGEVLPPLKLAQLVKRWLNKEKNLNLPSQLYAAAHAANDTTTQWCLWLLGDVCSAIDNQNADLHINFQVVFDKLERELFSPTWNTVHLPQELLSHSLYYASHLSAPEVKSTLSLLVGPLPSAEDVEKARGMLSGKNAAVVEVVAKSVRNDLNKVKDSLDLFLRTKNLEHIAQLPAQLHILEEVLQMAGMHDAQLTLEKQRSAIQSVLIGLAGNLIPDHMLSRQLGDIAHHILLAEDLIDQHVRVFTPVFATSTDDVTKIVLTEISVAFAKTRHAINDFRDNPTLNSKPQEASSLLTNIEGALAMIGAAELVPYVSALKRFVETTAPHQILDNAVLQPWADALVAIEYYIEAKNDYLPTLDDILSFASTAVKKFDPTFEPIYASEQISEQEETKVLSEDNRDNSDTTPVFAPENPEDVDERLQPTELDFNRFELSVVEASLNALEAGDDLALHVDYFAEDGEHMIVVFDGAATQEVDQNIEDIFSEELQEEIHGLSEWLPQLRSNHSNIDLLYNIRKSFHTIKGSGRMVGAKTLGDLSWKIESTLNQVMDGKRSLSPLLFEMIERGQDMFEKYLAALQGKTIIWNGCAFALWLDQMEQGVEHAYPIAAPNTPNLDSLNTEKITEEKTAEPTIEPSTVSWNDFGLENESATLQINSFNEWNTYDATEDTSQETTQLGLALSTPINNDLEPQEQLMSGFALQPPEIETTKDSPSASLEAPATPVWDLSLVDVDDTTELSVQQIVAPKFSSPEWTLHSDEAVAPLHSQQAVEAVEAVEADQPFPPLQLPPALPPYTGKQTDWKMHAFYLRSVKEDLEKIVNALDRAGSIEDFDRVQLHRVLQSLMLRQEEGLSVLETTMMEREKRVARAPISPPLTPVLPPLPAPPQVEVFVSSQPSQWEVFKTKLKTWLRRKK